MPKTCNFYFLPLFLALFAFIFFFPPGSAALEDEKSLEYQITKECRKKYSEEESYCREKYSEYRDVESHLLSACVGKAEIALKECMDAAKSKAQSDSPSKKKDKVKEDLLNRWNL
jgi:hypothetical protein